MLGVRDAEAGMLGRRNWWSNGGGAEVVMLVVGDVSAGGCGIEGVRLARVLLLCFVVVVVSPGKANPPCTVCPRPRPSISDDLRKSSCATTDLSTLSICAEVRVFLLVMLSLDAKVATGHGGSSCA